MAIWLLMRISSDWACTMSKSGCCEFELGRNCDSISFDILIVTKQFNLTSSNFLIHLNQLIIIFQAMDISQAIKASASQTDSPGKPAPTLN